MTKFKFKKRFGQNFLNDQNSIERIVHSISPKKEDMIVEIGPGSGAITKELKSFGSYLLAFEIDEDTKKYLLPLEDEKTKIVYDDFLSVDIRAILNSYKYCDLYLIGNLPYYITTPIIEHIIDSGIEHKSLTIMVQKEVADRFLATPGNREYGYMTVLLQYNYLIEKVIDVDRRKFTPVPNVDSTVLKLTTKKKENIDYAKFKQLLKDSFQFKRKTLNNNLKNYDRTFLEEILKKHGYNLGNRAEELDLETFLDMSRNI